MQAETNLSQKTPQNKQQIKGDNTSKKLQKQLKRKQKKLKRKEEKKLQQHQQSQQVINIENDQQNTTKNNDNQKQSKRKVKGQKKSTLHKVTNFHTVFQNEVVNTNNSYKFSKIYDISEQNSTNKENTQAKQIKFEKPSPRIELFRLQKYKKLEKYFETQCSENNIQPPANSFDRWIFYCKQYENENKISQDPLFPSCSEYVDKNLIADLERSFITPENAKTISQNMSDKAKELVKLIKQASKNQSKIQEVPEGKVIVKNNKHTLDIYYTINQGDQPFMKKIMKLNNRHYEKLQKLYNLQNSDNENENEQIFHDILFCLLLRYHTLQGHGFQAAMNEEAFQVLQKCTEVNFECFASPLNCFFSNFCSVFPDIDSFFGSKGSFFDYNPSEGSFEANPPFITDIMTKMVHHIENLLQKASEKPLSFIIVVPGWKEAEYWKLLQKSSYKKRTIFISKKEHGYCDGAQHQRRDRYRESPYDTAIFVLQNCQAAEKWVINKESEDQFRKAMAVSVASEQSIKRRVKSKRGLSDVDQGVKVEKKVKKKQKTQQ